MKIEIEDKYISTLKIMNYSVEEALSEFILLNISEKIAQYSDECVIYESKYEKSFQEFEEFIANKKEEENFVEEDDYLNWKFAEETKNLLQERLDYLV